MQEETIVNRKSLLAELLLTFMKIGFFTFGGGYAMISVIEDICVERKKWITHEEMMQMTVIAESTPGPIAINCATYVGQKTAGFSGSVISTFGIVLPSFLTIYIISVFLNQFLEYEIVAKAFQGIRIGVSLLILNVGISMVKKMKKKPLPRIIAACAFCAVLLVNLFSLKISTITLMVIAGIVSLALFCMRKDGGEG